MIAGLSPECIVAKAAGVEIPETRATVLEIDFKALKLKSEDWALASLAVLAKQWSTLNAEMLAAALQLRVKGKVFEAALAVTQKVVD